VTVWGYILEMPGRPSLKKQREVLGALGVDIGKTGPLWADKLDRAKRHRTAGRTQLAGRNSLINSVLAGDTVIVADPMCLGVSPQDAEWFLVLMSDMDVTVIVNGDLYRIEPGKSAAEVVGEFARKLNVYNARRSRGLST